MRVIHFPRRRGGRGLPALAGKVKELPQPAWVLFSGTFINKLGNFLSIFLVLYLTATGHSVTVAGAALSIVGGGNLVGNFIGGSVADRLGRRWTIIVSMFGSGVFTLLVPFCHDIILLFVLVGVVGVFAQIFRPAAGAVLLDVVPDDRRTTAFAVYRMAINLGMAAGPIIGGLISGYSYTWLFVGDSLTSLAYCVIAFTLLPETIPQKPAKENGAAAKTGYRYILRHDISFLFFLCAMTANTYIYVQATATLPLQVRDAGLPNTLYGLLLGLNAAVVVICELPITQVTEKLPTRAVIGTGMALMGAGFWLTAFAHSVISFAGTVLVWTLAEMIMLPLATAYPGRFAPGDLRGRYQGLSGLAQTAATAAGPVIGCFLFSRSHTLNWAMCAILGAVSVIFIAVSRPPGQRYSRRVGNDARPVPAVEEIRLADS